MRSIVDTIRNKFLITFIAMQVSLLCVFSIAGYLVVRAYGATESQEKAANIVDVFESLGRFGDFRYSKFIVSSLGKSLGLTSFHLYDESGSEIQGDPYKAEALALPPEIFSSARNMTEKKKLVFEKISLEQSHFAYAIKMDNGETCVIEITFERTQNPWLYSILILGMATVLTAIITATVTRRHSRQIGSDIEKFSSLVRKAQVDNIELPEAVFQELQPVSEAFQDLLHRLREQAKLNAIAQMTQMLAHDVRRPFSMLKMLLDGISRAKTPAQIQLFASKGIPETVRAMNSVNGLIQDVMEIGSNSEIFLSPAKPESLLEAALGEVFQSYPAANVSISYGLKHTSHVNVESGKVLRVFANVLGNAVQAMKQEGTIRIDTTNIEDNGGSYVKFVLGNNGPPIPIEHLQKLFEAFFTSGKKGGTGLGLAIAHKIVTAHGGRIWCESSPGIGVEFHLTLPSLAPDLVPNVSSLPKNSQEIAARFKSLGEADPDNDAEVRLEISLKNLLPDLGRRLSVLIVDDENIYRNSLTDSLNRHPELAGLLDVVSAEHSDGTLGLPSPDLAIVDVDLGPNSLSGFELVHEMRKRGQNAFVCIHSNRISASDSRTAIEQGADAFLPKPMSRAHLLKLLCQALERLGLVDPTLSSSSSGPIASTSSGESEKRSDSMISVLVDDMKFVRMSWEADWPLGKLVSFASPEKFWSHVDANPGFLDTLSCIVTDLNFGDLSAIDGGEFARQLKQSTQLPVLVASNSEVSIGDFGGAVDGILEKTPPDRATLEKYLKNR